jgi:ATP-dependent Clp protease ATP-binding subunit ClpC
MKYEVNLHSLRAQKARLSARIGNLGFKASVTLVWLFSLFSLFLLIQGGLNNNRGFYFFLLLTLISFSFAIWDKWDLSQTPASDKPKSLDDILEAKLLAGFHKKGTYTPQNVWPIATKQWQAKFICNHLLLDPSQVMPKLSNNPHDMEIAWQKAEELMRASSAKEIDGGTLTAALLLTSKEAIAMMSKQNLKDEDLLETYDWLERLNKFINQPNPYFGGIGRDWAAGFTPTLDRFGVNISRQIEAGQHHFHTLAHDDILDSVVHNLKTGSVSIVGPTGSGKSSLVYALATRFLRGNDEQLQYYQIYSLDASAILSEAKNSLERIILGLLAEAVHARNIIIFLDDASLFFGKGTGAFDASQILMPLLKNQNIKIIAAFTPDELQELKSSNGELTSHMPEVVVTEPKQEVVMDILEDSALTIEARNSVLISYPAIKEAFKLSGQYNQDISYPGRAISLLDQSLPYLEGKIMTSQSVQQAVEKTKGVKVSQASAPEADILLHLEDMIHARMINQSRAVKVVSGALRRSRAGVANPKRPIGSFLFLGPTGVGKTELARSLAAVYFGDEHNMIRLDMSEYQQADDVERLLDPGGSHTKSLIIQLREQPFSVLLLDEIEKAHPNILNLLLQMLDEGQLTDENGHVTSFRNAIIIATSNAGSAVITQKVGAGENLESFERPLIEELISNGQFRAELINRFDEVVLFRPLDKKELAQVANLMLNEVNKTLSNQNISVELTEAALAKVVEAGYDPEFGARPMRRALQKMVEDVVAKKVLSREAEAGSKITLDVNDLS